MGKSTRFMKEGFAREGNAGTVGGLAIRHLILLHWRLIIYAALGGIFTDLLSYILTNVRHRRPSDYFPYITLRFFSALARFWFLCSKCCAKGLKARQGKEPKKSLPWRSEGLYVHGNNTRGGVGKQRKVSAPRRIKGGTFPKNWLLCMIRFQRPGKRRHLVKYIFTEKIYFQTVVIILFSILFRASMRSCLYSSKRRAI